MAVGGALCGTANAEVISIDFEGNQTGALVDGQLNPFVSLNTTGGTGEGIIFDTNNPTGGDEDLRLITDLTPNVQFPAPAGNVLIVAENLIDADMNGLVDIPDDNGGGGMFTFDFTQDVVFLGFNAVDFTDGNGFLTVELFDAGGGELFSFTIDDIMRTGVDLVADVGDNVFFGLFENVFDDYGVDGVRQAKITLGGSGAIDTLTFKLSEVPVPAALPLMASALAFGGFASRRRKSKAARQA